jgi:coenzyme F420 hydrogenase subunit beta
VEELSPDFIIIDSIQTLNSRNSGGLTGSVPKLRHVTSELADLSVGMYEGKPGWNTMIVRSDTGAQIVDQARIEGFIETADFPDANLKHLSKAAADKKDRSLRTLMRRELINNENGRRAAVRIPTDIVSKITNGIYD